MTIAEVKEKLKALKLTGVIDTLETRAYQHQDPDVNFLEALGLLLQDEIDIRRSRKLERKFTESCLKTRKTLQEFDWSFNTKLPKSTIMDLFTLKFIPLGEDALFVGPPGTGKSHIAQALATQACSHTEYSVLYREAHKLFEDLFQAEQMGRKQRLYKKIIKTDLLIIDDLFLRKRLPSEATDDFQEIILDRYSERKATVITSNRVPDDWGTCLGDNAVATAILDRLFHRGRCLTFEGDSYRLKEASMKMKAKGKGNSSA